MSLIIRVMKPDEIQIAINLAAIEGWNPGIYDGNCFYNTDPKGFYLALDDGEPVGCISAIAYDESFGFVGFYIVKPEHRGEDFGKLLAIVAKRYMNHRNIGIDGVIERQENYARLGFKFSYRNIRFEYMGKGAESDLLTPIEQKHYPLIYDYDNNKFPAKRQHFLSMWLSIPNAYSLAKIEKGKLLGWGMLRSCLKGYKIGPLFAEDTSIAEEVLLALAAKSEGSPVYFDVPETNTNSIKLAEKYSMTKVFETARMYSLCQPEIDIEKVFGITSFELG